MTTPTPPYTDADLQTASEAIAREWGYASLAEADSARDREGEAVRAAARAALDALAAAGRAFLADDEATAQRAYANLNAAKPGDMFAFDQASGTRVVVVVARFEPAAEVKP